VIGEWWPLGLLAGVAWLWWDGLRKRELAMQAARALCLRTGVQLLDETVALRRLRLRRDALQRLRLHREFAFEYSSSGDDRLPGRVYLLGDRVVEAHLIEPA